VPENAPDPPNVLVIYTDDQPGESGVTAATC
jgi:hypothetical protein